MIPALEAIFGNRTAAAVLLYLENYDSGHASLIARDCGIPVSVVQDQLRRLEAAGVLVSRTVGRTRVFEFNPRNPSAGRLRDFLAAELRALPEEIAKTFFRQRRRPRRSGKPLERANR
ncbi:MAG: winged helix-turn-helix domain-containing protein [Woeseia sp.]